MEPDSKSPYQRYERDERWTAVDHYAISHLHPESSSNSSALSHAAELARSNGLPDIAVSPLQGQYLALQCRLINAKHVLEVGTLGAYSTIWMATSSPDVKITTVEYDPKHASVARRAIEYAGLSDRIEVLDGAGLDVLPKLAEEVQQGKREKWDLVFIDADKENNLAYLQHSVPMCRSRACIIVDNVVRKGTVALEELARTDPRVAGSRAVIEGAGKDDRIDATLMQIVGEKNYDGFLICAVK